MPEDGQIGDYAAIPLDPYRTIVIGSGLGEAISLPVDLLDGGIINFRPHGWMWEGVYHRFRGAPMTPEEIASVCHEANRKYQEIIGDTVAPPWPEASQHQQQSVIDGVLNALAHPDLTPRQSHENWLEFKRTAGWTYGEVKSDQARTHPCVREWDQLPVEDRAKDQLFLAIVRALS